MLKNENAYIWEKNEILNLSLSKSAEIFNFDKPLRIYKIKGEVSVKIYSDESKANLIYDGILDFVPISVVFTDKIFIETENTGVDIQIISEYGILKTDLSPYADKKSAQEYYIVEENNIYYSETNGILEAINISELKAADFVEYASITKPLSNNLIALKNPKIYKWTSLENGRKIKATISAYTYPKHLEKTADMSSESIIGIKHLSAEYSGNVGVSYSVDNAFTFSEELPIQEFLNIDLDALYFSLTATKTLILRFILNNDASISRFKILYKN